VTSSDQEKSTFRDVLRKGIINRKEFSPITRPIMWEGNFIDIIGFVGLIMTLVVICSWEIELVTEPISRLR